MNRDQRAKVFNSIFPLDSKNRITNTTASFSVKANRRSMEAVVTFGASILLCVYDRGSKVGHHVFSASSNTKAEFYGSRHGANPVRWNTSDAGEADQIVAQLTLDNQIKS